MERLRPLALLCGALLLAPAVGYGQGQAFRRGGVEFNAVRPVTLTPGKPATVVVTQFFHHGQIKDNGKNVVVATKEKGQKLVPCRVLQLGPGDYCRLAFQPVQGQSSYEIYYGGDAPAESELPPWTSRDGLLLETREFKQCNLNNFESVREAFHSSKPIGADYVDSVQHSHNPFSLAVGPFLSRYSGTLNLANAATYGFLTSSRDCSFLLVDDKVVVEAPGVHGPAHNAQRNTRKDIQLAAGPHKFEYYHAASGPEATMVAAWEINPADPKPQPVAIPPEVFKVAAVVREPAGPVSTREEKLAPDFLFNIAGSVPLPDNDVPLVGVQFADASPRGLAASAKYLWDFGDGQTSEEANPTHVYLRPALYAVKLTVRRANKPFETTNRVYIDQPKVTAKDKLHQLDDYLPLLRTFNPATLDARSLQQLVLAFLAKADSLTAPPEEPKPGAPVEEVTEAEQKKLAERAAAKKADALKYLAAAAAAGKVAFLEESAAKGDEDLLRLAHLVAPIARDALGDARLAGQIWQGASKRIAKPELKAECQVEAADVAVNDLVNAQAGKLFLDAAAAALKAAPPGPLAARLQRVWGDYYALTADGKAARKAYFEAEKLTASRRTNVERTAWQGAHGRSTEQFLKTAEYDRAAAQLRQWQEEFPADKVNGYVTLMCARYWAGREKYPQAIALAGQLSAVNGDSPYIDQILLLAAECELAQGDKDKAVARLEALMKNYPGSPLVPEVKEKLNQWKGEAPAKPKAK